ncbi:MAG: PilZ domain-containing protein [Desulfobacterales bacterium]|nr:PilZ domain-containing protein [Desulfobacterales bacterium]
MTENKRRHERYDSLNLLSYVCFDSDGKEWMQGIGRTLNISETGLQLETHEPIETKYVVLLSVGIEDDLVDIRGKVVYCNRGEDNKFECGIEFREVSQEAYTVLKRYISEFHKQYGK